MPEGCTEDLATSPHTSEMKIKHCKHTMRTRLGSKQKIFFGAFEWSKHHVGEYFDIRSVALLCASDIFSHVQRNYLTMGEKNVAIFNHQQSKILTKKTHEV